MIYSTPEDHWKSWELGFFALVLWREARGESFETKVAVACSIMNRVEHPQWWGSNLTEVLRKAWQYSSVTDTKDPQLTKWPASTDHFFAECLSVCAGVLEGVYHNPFKGSDSYFDDSLQGDQRPKWAKEHPERYVGKSGRLNFYNMDCDIEEPHVVTRASEGG